MNIDRVNMLETLFLERAAVTSELQRYLDRGAVLESKSTARRLHRVTRRLAYALGETFYYEPRLGQLVRNKEGALWKVKKVFTHNRYELVAYVPVGGDRYDELPASTLRVNLATLHREYRLLVETDWL